MSYPVDAPPQQYRWRGHNIAYYVDGDGPPLLLVHSVNAAASSFEMRQTFAGLRGSHKVYAFDMLGFGGSDRPAQIYSGQEMAALVADFTRDVIGGRAAAIASSLGAAYTIRAARTGGLLGPLVLICPTGIVDLAGKRMPGLGYGVLRGPVGDTIFAGLASRPSIYYFLSAQSYYDSRLVDDALVEGFQRATRHPGAKYAPICFLTGLLNLDIAEDFAALRERVLLVWGKQASITPPEHARDFLQRMPEARLEVFDNARLSVQDEHPERFNALVEEFLGQG